MTLIVIILTISSVEARCAVTCVTIIAVDTRPVIQTWHRKAFIAIILASISGVISRTIACEAVDAINARSVV